MHAARPYEYFEDAFLAWLDRKCKRRLDAAP